MTGLIGAPSTLKVEPGKMTFSDDFELLGGIVDPKDDEKATRQVASIAVQVSTIFSQI